MLSEQVRDTILVRMAEGQSLRSICRDEGMPSIWQVMRELRADEAFAQQYARAMLDRADAKFEELDAVSDDAVASDSAVRVAGLRLKADNIKWQLARMNAKKYGDVANVNLGGTVNVRPVEWAVVEPEQGS